MANMYTAMPIPPKGDLESLYFGLGMSQEEIGLVYRVGQQQISKWFKKSGIKARVPYKREQTRENNDSWRGDKAKYAALHYRVQALRGSLSCVTSAGGTTTTTATNGRM